MRLSRLFPLPVLLVALLLAGFAPAGAAEKKPVLTPAQEDAVRKLVREYLIKNPEVIVEAMQGLRAKQERERRERVQRTLVTMRKEIYEDPASPVAGNKKGDVTIVEFFDYQCGYCKSVVDRLMNTVKNDGKIRVVFKEFPILGPQSVFAARAALASRKQGKYLEFHMAMMKFRGQISQESVFAVAKSVGIDTKQLAADMQSDEVNQALGANIGLARKLGINGTPAFIIGKKLVPGAVNQELLDSYIRQARKKSG